MVYYVGARSGRTPPDIIVRDNYRGRRTVRDVYLFPARCLIFNAVRCVRTGRTGARLATDSQMAPGQIPAPISACLYRRTVRRHCRQHVINGGISGLLRVPTLSAPLPATPGRGLTRGPPSALPHRRWLCSTASLPDNGDFEPVTRQATGLPSNPSRQRR